MDADKDGVGGFGDGGSGNSLQSSSRINHYHKYSTQQIQRLERVFNQYTHPHDDVKMQLSRELGLSHRQIQFWFQNKRTQFKAHQAKVEMTALRVQNDRIQRENNAMKEALERKVCPSCRGPTSIDKQILLIENAHSKEKLNNVPSKIANYIGRPLSQLQSGNQGTADGLSIDLLSGNSQANRMRPFGFIFTDFDRSMMVEIANNALVELTKLFEINSPFWMNLPHDGRQILNREAYSRIFPRAIKSPDVWLESSKYSSIIPMSSLTLVEIFMDANKWMEVFPTIVSKSETIEKISTGLTCSQNGSLQLMYEEIQVISPLVPTRKFYYLRFCQQVQQNLWAIVDVTYDILQQQFDSQCWARRLPSGCYIEDMLNGHSKVTWMEHMQIEDKRPIHNFYMEYVHSGLAFGAERRLATLQRMCERFTCKMDSSNLFPNLGGVNPSPHGKRHLMKLSQRMVRCFCSSIHAVDGQQWMISKMNDFEVYTNLKKFTNHGHPHCGVLVATSTIWLPFSPKKIFDFLRNENTRPQWDVISGSNSIQEVGRIAYGDHQGNCISILKAFNTSHDYKLILQESSIDSSGSLVVYCPVDLPSMSIDMSGEDFSFTPLHPSGFVISPDWKMSGGALVTIVLQIFDRNATSGKISQESGDILNKLMGITINKIRAALN
ncbi:Homeodomain GLABROUS 11 [Heracleum sosnowskyi]|uniref:Homeodomain GLABROUS 11 n=1 Tax=Heracleum sosnowskyi TaxID=360622 RepID=A0AAD8HUV3_9APIA|nr:Homeodomain GLABROUS 11 [Heracleum sosnowskyi]